MGLHKRVLACGLTSWVTCGSGRVTRAASRGRGFSSQGRRGCPLDVDQDSSRGVGAASVVMASFVGNTARRLDAAELRPGNMIRLLRPRAAAVAGSFCYSGIRVFGIDDSQKLADGAKTSTGAIVVVRSWTRRRGDMSAQVRVLREAEAQPHRCLGVGLTGSEGAGGQSAEEGRQSWEMHSNPGPGDAVMAGQGRS